MAAPPTPQVILITGASSGIGAQTAALLHQAGHRVYGASRRHVAGVIPWQVMDVTDDSSVDAAIDAIIAAEGRLDTLINCAGYGIAGAVEDTSTAEAWAQFDTNYFGTVRVCRAVLPQMRAQKSGRIITIGSIGGLIAIPFQAHYSASKFALEGFCEGLRMEAAAFGIDVVLVEPGDFATGFTDARMKTAASTDSSPYRAQFNAALAQMEHDERHGPPPAQVARLIARIIATPRPRLRYPVGGAMQLLGIYLKRILPQAAFQRLIMQTYKLI